MLHHFPTLIQKFCTVISSAVRVFDGMGKLHLDHFNSIDLSGLTKLPVTIGVYRFYWLHVVELPPKLPPIYFAAPKVGAYLGLFGTEIPCYQRCSRQEKTAQRRLQTPKKSSRSDSDKGFPVLIPRKSSRSDWQKILLNRSTHPACCFSFVLS